MRKAFVYHKNRLAGTLTEYTSDNYEFRYDDAWLANDAMPAISLTLPKSHPVYKSNFLFPFFFNILSEGANKRVQCRQLKINENDNFGLLLATAKSDTIGAVTIEPCNVEEK